MNTYQVESSPQFSFEIRDTDNELANPTTVKVSIEEPDGTVVLDKQAADNDSTGLWHYDHDLGTVTGLHRLSLECVGAGSRVSIEVSQFRVVERFEE